ncbi:MAG: efflux RND transporter periplasmic adaptor subunit [Verrucomicrobia bacterium]|nr:efflux RND transporter periplasmic adaptor subunit [Verrucomicrobiota bacterium]
MRLLAPSVLLAAALPALAQTAAPVAVEVTSPRRGDIHRFVTLPATLRANQQVTLHAKVPGYLKSITVDRGDTVQAGQLLAELELPELVAARGRLTAELAIARTDADRIANARLKAPDLVTPQAADAAAARLAIAQAAVKENETMLGYAKITAPFAGVVTARNVDVGAFVPAATASANTGAAAIVTVMDTATVRVRVAVPEVEAARVKTGQPVVVTTDALPGKTFRGTVTRHASALDEGTRSLLVEADLPNADGTLRPGMYLSAKVGVELHTDTTLIPAAALVREKAAGFVFTLTDGKATKLPVKYGFIDGTNAEILDGLPANARVIIPGKIALTPGQAVTATEAK